MTKPLNKMYKEMYKDDLETECHECGHSEKEILTALKTKVEEIGGLRSNDGIGMFKMTHDQEESFKWGHARAIVDVISILWKEDK